MLLIIFQFLSIRKYCCQFRELCKCVKAMMIVNLVLRSDNGKSQEKETFRNLRLFQDVKMNLCTIDSYCTLRQFRPRQVDGVLSLFSIFQMGILFSCN
jgi:hypothetical protein